MKSGYVWLYDHVPTHCSLNQHLNTTLLPAMSQLYYLRIMIKSAESAVHEIIHCKACRNVTEHDCHDKTRRKHIFDYKSVNNAYSSNVMFTTTKLYPTTMNNVTIIKCIIFTMFAIWLITHHSSFLCITKFTTLQ